MVTITQKTLNANMWQSWYGSALKKNILAVLTLIVARDLSMSHTRCKWRVKSMQFPVKAIIHFLAVAAGNCPFMTCSKHWASHSSKSASSKSIEIGLFSFSPVALDLGSLDDSVKFMIAHDDNSTRLACVSQILVDRDLNWVTAVGTHASDVCTLQICRYIFSSLYTRPLECHVHTTVRRLWHSDSISAAEIGSMCFRIVVS